MSVIETGENLVARQPLVRLSSSGACSDSYKPRIVPVRGMPGKVSPDDLLTHVFERTGAAESDETVVQGPADGEDAAAIDWPDGEGTLVVSSDPISLAAEGVGELGVYVATNDVAVSGADPRWLTAVVLLPSADNGAADGDDTAGSTDSGRSLLEEISHDLDAAAREVGASIVGGHSEYVDQLERPLLSLTAMGATDRFVPTGGAAPGDAVILTKAAGIEGSAILAADFGDELDIDPEVRERAEAFLDEISVVPEARIVREYATAMHDPTEGGVAAGLLEVARASSVRLTVDRDASRSAKRPQRCARRPASTRSGSSAPARYSRRSRRTRSTTALQRLRTPDSRPPKSARSGTATVAIPNSVWTASRSPTRSRTTSIPSGNGRTARRDR